MNNDQLDFYLAKTRSMLVEASVDPAQIELMVEWHRKMFLNMYDQLKLELQVT